MGADIRKSARARGKSINLALSHRGLEALKNAGIPFADFSHLVVSMKGRMIHKRRAECQAFAYDVKYHQVKPVQFDVGIVPRGN